MTYKKDFRNGHKRDRIENKIFLNQQSYISKVLNRYSISDFKFLRLPLANHFNQCVEQCPKTEEKYIRMNKISYANVVDYVMYSKACTRPYLAFAVPLVDS